MFNLFEFETHLPVQGDQGFAVFQFHSLLGKIRWKWFVPVTGMTGDAFLTLTKLVMTLLEIDFGSLGIHFASSGWLYAC
jgi:hypothetical protein